MSTILKPRPRRIRFEQVVEEGAPGLPRMDVAGFVGFASSGPLHTPVPVDSVERFEDVFGADLALAWDDARGELVRAHLGPVVRAFFANGGQRCWVVRVADGSIEGTESELPLPGTLLSADGSPVGGASLFARSAGRWGDGVALNVTLREDPLGNVLATWGGSGPVPSSTALSLEAPPDVLDSVGVGDVLRLDIAGPDGPLHLYAPVERMRRRVTTATTGGVGALNGSRSGPALIDVREPRVFRPLRSAAEATSLAAHGSLPAVVLLGARSTPTSATCVPSGAPTSPPSGGAADDPLDPTTGRLRLSLPAGVAGSLRAGGFVLIEIPTSPPGELAVLVMIEEVELDGGTGASSPPASLRVTGRAWTELDPAAAVAPLFTGSPPTASVAASLPRLELWARLATGEVRRVRDVACGFVGSEGSQPAPVPSGVRGDPHPRSIFRLPTDRELFSAADIPGTPDERAFRTELSQPRFPLASRRSSGASSRRHPDGDRGDLGTGAGPTAFVVPLGVGSVPRSELFTAALEPVTAPTSPPAMVGPRLDGVHRFDRNLFQDARLASLRGAALRERAFQTFDVDGERLDGIHALLPVPGVAMASIPDATHVPWGEPAPPPPRLEAPRLTVGSPPMTTGFEAIVTWAPVLGAGEYVVQRSTDPWFDPVKSSERQDETVHRASAPGEGCREVWYIRVRALGPLGASPWSETFVWVVDVDDFAECRSESTEAPTLTGTIGPSSIVLRWTGDPGDRYRLVLAADPDFGSQQFVWEGDRRSEFVVHGLPAVTQYFRIARDRSGRWSPWSNTVVRPGLERPAELPVTGTGGPAAGPSLVELQLRLIELCHARGDLTCILSLPKDTDAVAADAHRAELTRRAPIDDTGSFLSFGGLYVPWVVSPRGGERGARDFLSTPPDGHVAGALAATARARGAWSSPGRHALRAITAFDAAGRIGTEDLMIPRVNSLVRSPLHWALEDDASLSASDHLARLGVRRLLILLRRLAEERGQGLVFEPNSSATRRRTRRLFERLLDDLHRRGALAGAEPAEAYSVIVGPPAGTVLDIERGRLIAEIRVAPSHPLHFITVRLLERGGTVSLTEAAS